MEMPEFSDEGNEAEGARDMLAKFYSELDEWVGDLPRGSIARAYFDEILDQVEVHIDDVERVEGLDRWNGGPPGVCDNEGHSGSYVFKLDIKGARWCTRCDDWQGASCKLVSSIEGVEL